MTAKFGSGLEPEEDYFEWYAVITDDTDLTTTKLKFPFSLRGEIHYDLESIIGLGATWRGVLRLPQATRMSRYSEIVWQPKITPAANRFLERNPGVREKVLELDEVISSILHDKGVMNKSHIDIARDIESPKWEAIEIRVEISGKRYSDILDIWGQVSKKVYKDLDREIAKKYTLLWTKPRTSE